MYKRGDERLPEIITRVDVLGRCRTAGNLSILMASLSWPHRCPGWHFAEGVQDVFVVGAGRCEPRIQSAPVVCSSARLQVSPLRLRIPKSHASEIDRWNMRRLDIVPAHPEESWGKRCGP